MTADLGTPRVISDAEREVVTGINALFGQFQIYRNVHAAQWEEAAALIDVTSRNTFYYGSYNFPGQKKTQQQVDATGAAALRQFCAISDSMVTPKNRIWHGLKFDEYFMKNREVRLYVDQLTKILFDFRYRSIGNFHGENYSNWKSLGAYGNSTMFIDRLDNRWHRNGVGLRYRGVPLGETFYGENHQGIVTFMIRWFRRTTRQAVEAWGEEWLPAQLQTAYKENLQTPFNFLHVVRPRDPSDFDPSRFDEKGKPFSSHYMSIEGQCLMGPEGGYRVFPYAVSRYDKTPGEVYGRGPAQIVLPALKTLNAQKATLLKQAHRAGDPIYLLPEDGIADFDSRPGATVAGGMNSDGKRLVDIVPFGEVQVTEKMMGIESSIIEQEFLTPLFKTLMQNPNMTATQVVELFNERGMLVAPTLGRQFSEFVGGLVPRELDVLDDMRDLRGRRVLPPMPQMLVEAFGTQRISDVFYEVTDTTPLALAARSNEVSGAMRSVEFARQIVIDTGDQTPMYYFNWDTLMPDVQRVNGMLEKHTATPQQVAEKKKNAAQAEQQKQQLESLPGQAAMLNAKTKLQKVEGVGAQQQQPQQAAA